jgi:hypothetical protein
VWHCTVLLRCRAAALPHGHAVPLLGCCAGVAPSSCVARRSTLQRKRALAGQAGKHHSMATSATTESCLSRAGTTLLKLSNSYRRCTGGPRRSIAAHVCRCIGTGSRGNVLDLNCGTMNMRCSDCRRGPGLYGPRGCIPACFAVSWTIRPSSGISNASRVKHIRVTHSNISASMQLRSVQACTFL